MALYQCIAKCWHKGKLYRIGDTARFSDDYPTKSPVKTTDKDGNETVVKEGGGLAHFILIEEDKKPTVVEVADKPAPSTRPVVKVNRKEV